MTSSKRGIAGSRLSIILAILFCEFLTACFGLAATADAHEAVLTRSYDNARTGANTHEKSFTPASISTDGLKKAFSLKLEGDDPRVEAQGGAKMQNYGLSP